VYFLVYNSDNICELTLEMIYNDGIPIDFLDSKRRCAVKRIILILMIILNANIYLSAKPKPVGISFGIFYNSLSQYGEWIELDFGMNVWRPRSVHRDWRPYTIGSWSWTKHGWYWDSYEPFGWATYHYGRWYYDEYYGWIWIPDYEWGPSWVEWRYDDYYIGWAPLPPYAGFRINIGIQFSINWNSHYSYWNFVRYDRFCHNRVHYYIVDNSRNHRIFSRTKYRTNYYMERDRLVNGGLDRDYIERKAGYRISERDIASVKDYKSYEKNRSSYGDRIISYRPSEKEIEKYRNYNDYEVKKSERRTSLDNEKLVVNDRAYSTRERSSDRNNEKLVNRDSENRNVDFDKNKRELNKRENIDLRNDKNENRIRDYNRQMEFEKKEKREVKRDEPRIERNRESEMKNNRSTQQSEPRIEFKRESNNERTREYNKPDIPSRSERRVESNERNERSKSSERTERNNSSERKRR